MNRRMKRNAAKQRRNILMVVALMLVVCVASIGGTIAWLTDTTSAVTNTFSPSNIDLWMTETVSSTEQSTKNNTSGITNAGLHIVPGLDIAKDPKVAAVADVPYYVFVKVTESNWPIAMEGEETNKTRKVNYQIAEGWTELTGESYTHPTGAKVYYKAMTNGGTLGTENEGTITGVSVLANDEVTVSEALDKTELNAIGTGEKAPTLSFTAYAIQMQKGNEDGAVVNFTAVEAWNIVSAGN